MHYSIVFSFLAILLLSCSSNNIVETKMDVSLRQKISSIEKKSSDESILFVGKCSNEIDDSIKEKISELGIEVQTVVGNIFTASGKSNQIKELSSFEFIESLELSQDRLIK